MKREAWGACAGCGRQILSTRDVCSECFFHLCAWGGLVLVLIGVAVWVAGVGR